MSLKDVIDSVCDAVEIDRFDAFYGNADPGAQTMLQLGQQAGEEISTRAEWKDMLKVKTITASGDVLPTDFGRIVSGGVRTASNLFARPVTNSGIWSTILQVGSTQPYYFLRRNVILFSPLTAGVGAVLDYVVSTWVVTSAGTYMDKFTADDDTTAFPEKLLAMNIIWRWRRAKGLAYDDQLAEFEAALVQEINFDRGAA